MMNIKNCSFCFPFSVIALVVAAIVCAMPLDRLGIIICCIVIEQQLFISFGFFFVISSPIPDLVTLSGVVRSIFCNMIILQPNKNKICYHQRTNLNRPVG